MAHWALKWFRLMARPDSNKSQPMGVLGSAGGHDSTYGHVDDDERATLPPVEGVSVWPREVQGQEKET